MYDVAIVGAGPAGSAAANILASNGFKTIVLEKETLPRFKCCAGGVSLRCNDSLSKLKIDIDEVAVHRYKGFALGFDEIIAKSNLKRTIGWGVYREDFDNLIAKSAIYNGARITKERVLGFKKENGKIKILTDKITRESRLLFGADGIRSVIRKNLGILYNKEKMGICLMSEFKTDSDFIESFEDLVHIDFSYLTRGYAWAFPKKEGNTINMGIGGYIDYIKNLDISLKNLFFKLLKKYNVNYNNEKITGALLPFGGTLDCFGIDNIILLGDAAGLVSPMDGEGIPYALESGIIASDCAKRYFENNDNLADTYRKEIEPITIELNNHALALQNKIYGSKGHRRNVVKCAAQSDKIMETISRIFTHIIPYDEGVKRLSTIRLIPGIIRAKSKF
jgi:geranylgeranyl reductase family protein